MKLLLRAVITGIGLKIGADIYLFIKKQLGFPCDKDEEKDEAIPNQGVH